MICLLVASSRFALVVIWMKSIPCLAGNILMHLLCSFVHKRTFQDEYCKLFSGGSRPSDKVGGGEGGRSQKNFFPPFGPQFGGLKVREGRAPRPPPLDPPLLSDSVCEHYCLVLRKKKQKKKKKSNLLTLILLADWWVAMKL